MKQKQRTRFVKLYFRDQNKVMRAIPNIEGMVTDDVLLKVYTRLPGRGGLKIIYEVKE
jgi:hypothetical protein